MKKQQTESQKIQQIQKFIFDNSLDGEQWKMIPNTKNYFVSSQGRVLSACRSRPRLLKPQRTGSNYYYVKIHGKNQRVHRLVAAAFLPPPPSDCRYQIHHKDGNALNNALSNLEYLSPDEHRKKHKELAAAAATQEEVKL